MDAELPFLGDLSAARALQAEFDRGKSGGLEGLADAAGLGAGASGGSGTAAKHRITQIEALREAESVSGSRGLDSSLRSRIR